MNEPPEKPDFVVDPSGTTQDVRYLKTPPSHVHYAATHTTKPQIKPLSSTEASSAEQRKQIISRLVYKISHWRKGRNKVIVGSLSLLVGVIFVIVGLTSFHGYQPLKFVFLVYGGIGTTILALRMLAIGITESRNN